MIPGTSIATFRDYPAMSALRRFRPSRPILPASWCPACPNLGGSQLAQCAFRFARRVALREFLSSPACENILLFRNSDLPCGLAIPPRLQRGVSRSSRHARRVAVDADVPIDERHDRGRRSRVVLARPCRRQVGDDACASWPTTVANAGSPGRARSKP